jgi:hypothetical protein
MRTTGCLFDRAKVLARRRYADCPARGLGIRFPSYRTCQQNCRRHSEGNHQLAHHFLPGLTLWFAQEKRSDYISSGKMFPINFFVLHRQLIEILAPGPGRVKPLSSA